MTIPTCRESESALLNEIWNKDEAAFVALYGRRRVGKTYLVRSLFKDKPYYIEITGSKDGSLSEQLQNFTDAFSEVFAPGLELKPPSSWREAFKMLTEKLTDICESEKCVVFLDELPWLATPRSRLLQNLDYFWNRHWSKIKNLKLIACGSAASWILDNLVNAKGGLYNRITQSILLEPFTLKQTESFLHQKKFKYTRKQILDLYMVAGGVPFYLSQCRRSKSVTQNINDICFRKDGLLYDEFSRVFDSLFGNNKQYSAIVTTLAKKPFGLSGEELSKKLNTSFGGRFSKRLDELAAAGFIKRFYPIGREQRDSYYKLIDEYSMFYLNWIKPFAIKNESPGDDNYWHTKINTPQWNTWAGHMFEKICFKHLGQIKRALNINTIESKSGSWLHQISKSKTDNGAQIDLVFDRADDTITLIEIKYSQIAYTLDKKTAQNIANKIKVFEKYYTIAQKQVLLTLVTTQGLKAGIWAEDLIDSVITLDHLFK